MIADRRPLSLVVEASAGSATSNQAVSLGLLIQLARGSNLRPGEVVPVRQLLQVDRRRFARFLIPQALLGLHGAPGIEVALLDERLVGPGTGPDQDAAC